MSPFLLMVSAHRAEETPIHLMSLILYLSAYSLCRNICSAFMVMSAPCLVMTCRVIEEGAREKSRVYVISSAASTEDSSAS